MIGLHYLRKRNVAASAKRKIMDENHGKKNLLLL
jgi:hypothetical protein